MTFFCAAPPPPPPPPRHFLAWKERAKSIWNGWHLLAFNRFTPCGNPLQCVEERERGKVAIKEAEKKPEEFSCVFNLLFLLKASLAPMNLAIYLLSACGVLLFVSFPLSLSLFIFYLPHSFLLSLSLYLLLSFSLSLSQSNSSSLSLPLYISKCVCVCGSRYVWDIP